MTNIMLNCTCGKVDHRCQRCGWYYRAHSIDCASDTFCEQCRAQAIADIFYGVNTLQVHAVDL